MTPYDPTCLILYSVKRKSAECSGAKDQSDPVSVLYTPLKASLSFQCMGKSTRCQGQGLKGDK